MDKRETKKQIRDALRAEQPEFDALTQRLKQRIEYRRARAAEREDQERRESS
jgi:hypothetical protein